MIPSKITALFKFIEFLHSNIENLNQYDGLISEIIQLQKEIHQLKPTDNFKDKLKYDVVKKKSSEKLKRLNENTTCVIKSKAIEINICNLH